MKKWNDGKPLNVTIVEQIQNDLIAEKGQMPYEFLRADYIECLELFATDISKLLELDIVLRLITMYRIVYGNRMEIEAALVSTHIICS